MERDLDHSPLVVVEDRPERRERVLRGYRPDAAVDRGGLERDGGPHRCAKERDRGLREFRALPEVVADPDKIVLFVKPVRAEGPFAFAVAAGIEEYDGHPGVMHEL